MRGPAARFLGIALAAAGVAAAAPAIASPASERYEDGLAAYNRNDFDKSLKLLRPVAEKGDARAQYLIGRHYQFGQGVKADRAEAYFWYKRAEAKGHLEAKLFRQLLEKRWKITGDERGRAERKLTSLNAPPKPAVPAVAETTQKTTPPEKKIEKAEKAKPEKAKLARPAETVASKEKPKPDAPAIKSKPEFARIHPQESPKPEPAAKAKTELAKPAPTEKPAPTSVVATRSTPGADENSTEVLRGTTSIARLPTRPAARDDYDEDHDGTAQRRNGAPPPETRTPVAATPTRPPPSDDEGPSYPPGYSPTPTYAPPAPYYAPSPGPYYAPAAPPSWRASVYYGPRPYYRDYRVWGPRPYAGYMHPGWRGRRW